MIKTTVATHKTPFIIDDFSLTSVEIRNGHEIDIAPLDATFRDSRRAQFHSWFPYLEGYSPKFVERVKNEYLPDAKRILEPFAGSGTTPIILGQIGIECAYAEANPAMAFIIQTKLSILRLTEKQRRSLSNKIIKLAKTLHDRVILSSPNEDISDSYLSTFKQSVFFDAPSLYDILRLRTLNDEVNDQEKIVGDCLTLSILASLIPSSRLKRSGDLRFKTTKELLLGTPNPIDAVRDRLLSQAEDIVFARELRAQAHFACDTAVSLKDTVDGDWDGVITSPPYLNGTNYIRNARLELWYLRQIKAQADIRRLRDIVITSGINDVDAQTDWRPITDGVDRVVTELKEKAYDDRISKMVGGYFRDMSSVLLSLTACVKDGGRLCVDIGDSIYAGVHVPTDDLLVEVANNIGLHTLERIHLRKRTSKGGQPVRQQLLVFEKRACPVKK
jgi:DNA modification methylase